MNTYRIKLYKYLKYTFLFILLMIFGSCINVRNNIALNSNQYVVIELDQRSIDQIGRFPFPRKLMGNVVNYLHESDARLIILKFFYDEPSKFGVEDDQYFISSISNSANVILQASLVDESQPIYDRTWMTRYQITNVPSENLYSGSNAWLVHTPYISNIIGLGFVTGLSVNKRYDYFPVAINYYGNTYPSLSLEIIKRMGHEYKIVSNFLIIDNSKPINLTKKYLQYKIDFDTKLFKKYSFYDVLNKKIPSMEFKNKCVIISANYSIMQKLDTEIGPMNAHTIFLYALKTLLDRVDIK